MGYRVLLKRYMKQLRNELGSDFVEQFANKEALSKRDIGELRTLAAEINRETLEADLQ